MMPCESVETKEDLAPIHNKMFKCHICDNVEYPEQPATLHLFNAHKADNIYRLFIHGTHCPIRLKQFHNRDNLLKHYRDRKVQSENGRICIEFLYIWSPWLTPAASEYLDKEERTYHSFLCSRGCLGCVGDRRSGSCHASATWYNTSNIYIYIYIYIYVMYFIASTTTTTIDKHHLTIEKCMAIQLSMYMYIYIGDISCIMIDTIS